jgi:SAM-dependent methyltransferase
VTGLIADGWFPALVAPTDSPSSPHSWSGRASRKSGNVPDASVDAVISSLVLCTVPDPAAVVAEVHRVLRPGGRYAFVEHVAAA